MKKIKEETIFRVNQILNEFFESNEESIIEFGIYSCKKSKNNFQIKIPLRFLISALEECFVDYDFSGTKFEDFIMSKKAKLIEDIRYVFSTQMKNSKDSDYMTSKLMTIIGSEVRFKPVKYYKYLMDDDPEHVCYFIYDSKKKKVVFLKIKIILNN